MLQRRWLRICAALVLGATCGTARAEEPAGYYEPAGYTSTSTLAARLDQQEAEIAALRQQLQAVSSASEAADEEEELCGGWKKVELGGKTVKVGGRVFVDHMTADQQAGFPVVGDLENRTRFDAARIKAEGTLNDWTDFRIEMDFGGGETTTVFVPPTGGAPGDWTSVRSEIPTFKDVYMTMMELPAGSSIRIGHFKEPWSLEEQTSSRFTNFMERSIANIFSPSRNIGMMAFANPMNENLGLYTGIFRTDVIDNPPDIRTDSSDLSWTSRVVFLPLYDESNDGRYLVHLGACTSWRQHGDGFVELNSQPELGITSSYVTLALPCEESYQACLEGAIQLGAFEIQSEYFWNQYDQAGADPVYEAAYIEASYFLTGENRGYKRVGNAFDRVEVLEPFFWGCGWGAWQVAARASYIDCLDGAALGFQNADSQEFRSTYYTLGLNWYPNSYSRFMFNYIVNELDEANGGDAENNFFGMRCQFDF